MVAVAGACAVAAAGAVVLVALLLLFLGARCRESEVGEKRQKAAHDAAYTTKYGFKSEQAGIVLYDEEVDS